MKVDGNGNITVFLDSAGQRTGLEEKAGRSEKKADEKQSNVIFAGNFQGDKSLRDRIEQRKAQAQESAMKVVREAWNGDRAIDEDLNERREHIRELNQSSKEAQDRITGYKEQQEALKSAYGVTDNSQEAEELELLRKRNAAMRGEGSMSKEEWEECARIEKEGLTEYQRMQLELDGQINENERIIADNDTEVLIENAVIRGTRLERLKYHKMTDAQKQAEEIKEAAGDEITGMIMDDAKEKLDEEQEEREEQAEDIKEKLEEQEELIEKRTEKRDELEELVENMPVDEMMDVAMDQSTIQREVQNIVNKMALVAEDIKGAVVDENL